MKGMYGVETTHPATVIIVVDTLKILPDLAIEGDCREEIEDMGLLSRHVSVLCQLEGPSPSSPVHLSSSTLTAIKSCQSLF